MEQILCLKSGKRKVLVIMGNKYYNYHCHNHKGNIKALDVIVKQEDYCKRAVELGHDAFFTTCHGMQGDIFEATTLAHQYNLKMIVGAECYYVPNRFEKDKSNRHIIIIALNYDGIRELNDIISESNITGMYYKPRIDDELLFSLTPSNFIITTACVAGLWDNKELILRLKDYFGFNFYLEVQDHNVEIQKEVNRYVLELSKRYNIRIIHANDSHYIYPQDSKYRDLFLKAKGIIYEEENDFILDYPDYDEIVKRYEIQGVLNKNQIRNALENTLVFENIDCSNYITDDIKLPSISDTPNEALKEILNNSWENIKSEIPIENRPKYIDAIRYEMDIIEKTNMANYFLIDYYIAKIAKEKYNGVLTKTGRGSAPSFYTTRLLDLTNIDRLASPITLFPTRFMSVERILGARSMPDIDLNSADAEPFIKASKDLLGEENCEWMISWKPLQESSGFRLYCRAIGLDINEYNDVAKDLDKYKDDKKWGELIEKSKPFIGVIEGISESPCSMCLGTENLRKAIGLVRTPNDKICCMLDGYNCDKYKYLKNDYLTVTVWAIIRDVCNLANISIPTIKELDNLLDEKTFDIYREGLTCSINQADSNYATGLVKKYAPKSLAEMSAFVAIIRPGCASLLNDFIARKEYTTGVKELDNLLEDSEHRLIYQESIMKYLIWLGIPETSSYDIIKKIAKKKFKEQELKELKDKLIEGWKKQVGGEEGFEETWKVVEDASRYSFNCSHSLSYAYDSLYGAYLKSHYPLEYYTVAFDYYKDDSERTSKLTDELKYFNIKLSKPKFRYSKSSYFMDRETNTIYKGVASIKYLNDGAAEYLYSLRHNHYDNFISLLQQIEEDRQINSRQMEILIQLQYFDEFGKNKKLLDTYKYFKALYGRKTLVKEKLADQGLTTEDIIDCYEKETEKQYVNVDYMKILANVEKRIPNEIVPITEQVLFEVDVVGYISMIYDVDKRYCLVTDIDTKYSPRVTLYSLGSGKEVICKISKTLFNEKPFKRGQLIKCGRFFEKYKQRKTENGWEQTKEKEWWLNDYELIDNLEI
uniref:DNA-directed DNA polymerase n=1 Tax=Siphoviridae sp. ctsUY14 TaxID=2825693 RepID=A0A8S5P5R7_9CAUD|nr:MAG TPA: DNA-directed DNA polymerase [Siphoviridae sp. ctsUY14]